MRGFTPEALDTLSAHDWPGNLRELINVVERAVLLCAGELIERADLPEELGSVAVAAAPAPLGLRAAGAVPAPFVAARRAALEQFERGYLVDLLDRSGGRVGEAASRAGLNPRSLYDLLRRHGIRWRDFRFSSPRE
ncbi:MAG: hypothetical protein O2894_13490 [Planctomycetota bacterium]|nr:hypothetical protein [Planctomycetota bacterium]